LKVLDKVFETLPAGKKITQTEADSLVDILRKTELDIPSTPKKLTLSEVHEDHIDDIVEDIQKYLSEKFNFQVFELDFDVVLNFNKKVGRLKSEFGSMVESNANKSSRPMDSSDLEIVRTLKHHRGEGQKSSKKAEHYFDLESDKENNRLDLNIISDVNLTKNKIDKISLECDEKLKIFKEDHQIPLMKDGPVDVSNLECEDEILIPPPTKKEGLSTNEDQLFGVFKNRSDSSIMIDDEDLPNEPEDSLP